jgi:enoyl-CoA hydratase/carnithine racemase
MTQDTRILLRIDGAVAVVTLNREAKLNAIDPQMLAELDAVLASLEARDDIFVVLLTGSGSRSFSVGADIHAWSALPALDRWRTWMRDGHRVFERVARLRQPVIAVLNGYTFGGGLELALAADLRLAAEHAELAMPETTIGTVPGWGGTARLPLIIGPARAKQMILTGARIDAQTAERWGLVNEVVRAEHLLERARQLAMQIAGNASVAVQMAKQLLDGTHGYATNVALESLAGALAATTDDGREGTNAFKERRPPRYSGS